MSDQKELLKTLRQARGQLTLIKQEYRLSLKSLERSFENNLNYFHLLGKIKLEIDSLISSILLINEDQNDA